MRKATTKWERFEWRYPWIARVLSGFGDVVFALVLVCILMFFVGLITDSTIERIESYTLLTLLYGVLNAQRS